MKYYKRPEPRGNFPAFPFNYYKVAPGEQTCINFLNDCPIIIETKKIPFQFPPLNRDVVEVGIPISEEEFNQALKFALRKTETT